MDEVLLRWPGVSGASLYRVLLRAQGGGAPLFEAEVAEPSVRIPSHALPEGRRCEWRVLVRKGFGGWAQHLPEIVRLDDQLLAEPELAWPEVPGALAYRVLVRDDHAGEIVSKQGFLSSPGRIDWSTLDPSHLHRVRVQAWVDSAWQDHLPYQWVFPPAGRSGDVVELAWPPDPQAISYRVLMPVQAAQTVLVEVEVRDPALRVPAALVASSDRLEWRVMVRREQDAKWEEYLPELVLVDDELAAQPAVSWPPAVGALAYRVVTRDVELDEVVLKHGFLDSPGWIDWSGLEPAHMHRARVQAWIDGAWRDHVPSRRLFPPPEKILRQAPGVSQRLLAHVIVVRFPAGSVDSLYGVDRPPALTARRLELFRSWTLPSLRLLTGEGVEWFVVADPELPAAVRQSLGRLCGERLIDPRDGAGPVVADGPGGVAIAWLTAGEALHVGVPAAVERRAAVPFAGAEEPLCLEFPLSVEASPKEARLAWDRATAPFVVVLEPPGRGVRPADPRHPVLRVRSLARVADYSVAPLLRARPGPNEHPAFVRLRGPLVEPGLLNAFGVETSSDDGVPTATSVPA